MTLGEEQAIVQDVRASESAANPAIGAWESACARAEVLKRALDESNTLINELRRQLDQATNVAADLTNRLKLSDARVSHWEKKAADFGRMVADVRKAVSE